MLVAINILSHWRQRPASRAPGPDQAPQDAYCHGARVRRVGNAAVGPLRNGEGGVALTGYDRAEADLFGLDHYSIAAEMRNDRARRGGRGGRPICMQAHQAVSGTDGGAGGGRPCWLNHSGPESR
jgi:hypothetical protein